MHFVDGIFLKLILAINCSWRYVIIKDLMLRDTINGTKSLIISFSYLERENIEYK